MAMAHSLMLRIRLQTIAEERSNANAEFEQRVSYNRRCFRR